MATKTLFKTVRLSLEDLLGRAYIEAVVEASARLMGRSPVAFRKVARRKVDFFPPAFQASLISHLSEVGARVTHPLQASRGGASTCKFNAASRLGPAPLTGCGYYRIGQDGRLYFLSKSEHYHAPLGHAFPGYRLLDHARALGIPNATHNNTRGHITRLLEEELVRTASGIPRADRAALARTLGSRRAGVLNRVLNLETGSLSVEAGIKMMLARFYRVQDDVPPPKYAGRTPVFVVIGDQEGGLLANYHGTTIFAQMMRGMWPDLSAGMEGHGLVKVVPVRPNHLDDFETVFRQYERGRFKIAGFLHELILMNYGGLRLLPRFIKRAYALCRKHDVPTLIDEIQSCLWSPDLYLFREYDLRPTFVAVGKGFPGGEYPASRIIFSATMDCLPQFGALVTNGQEELASLAYLVTMRWAEANRHVTVAIGDRYEARLRELVERYPRHLTAVEGRRHMASLYFRELEQAKAFVAHLADGGLDISVQTYKAACPPGALTKLPLIADDQAVAMVVERMEAALHRL